jgi:cysteinyl-tRNA synthetase
MLKIHNSLTGTKEEFRPLNPPRVGMYVCGMTVYDYIHMGHARMLVVFDVVARYLRSLGYQLTYVRNITDIDDKIIKRAAENGEPIDALTARFIAANDEDFAALGLMKPDHEPRATQHIAGIIRMIEQLIARGYAYVADDGDVLYAVRRFEGYGKLSGKQLDELRAGARVEVDAAKRDPLDFVLWKAAKAGEPAWDSPWGRGRPGWHIECSVMSTATLGTYFDIHGGGVDLKFPHHENEIAQSCAATGAPFVRLWMHNGFVNVDDEKMSKSLGNFFTLRDVLKAHHPEAVRYFLTGSQYRGPINYTNDSLVQARAALDRLYTALRGVPVSQATPDPDALQRFKEAMDDDFNTPEALAVIQSLARDLNAAKAANRTADAATLASTIRQLGRLLGIVQSDPEAWLKQGGVGQSPALTDAAIEALIEARRAARAAKNWKESDRIRDELAAAGVVLEDGALGTTWRRR